jgi:hypothetical protein
MKSPASAGLFFDQQQSQLVQQSSLPECPSAQGWLMISMQRIRSFHSLRRIGA